jgi:hypothetical protein
MENASSNDMPSTLAFRLVSISWLTLLNKLSNADKASFVWLQSAFFLRENNPPYNIMRQKWILKYEKNKSHYYC